MLKHCLAACLLLTPIAAARGEELFGLDSLAIDISEPIPRNEGQYAAAFTSIGRRGRPTGIRIQSRYTEPGRGLYSCMTILPLPTRRTRRISHPALSKSGWVFASATEESAGSAGWNLYGARRQGDALANYCSGWSNWIDLGRFSDASGQRAVASAPDAVVVGPETYVFVTSAGGFIDYRKFDGERWRPWTSLRATGSPRHRAGSKPAVAAYTFATPLGDVTALHVFWLGGGLGKVFHGRAYPLVGSSSSVAIESHEPTSRAFGNPAGRARTACSAGPELIEPAPLFIVCGSTGPRRAATYSIARFRATSDLEYAAWASDEAVELIGTDAWTSRNLFGGSSAPSLGPTGLANAPLMFVAYGSPCDAERFAPYAVRPAPQFCIRYNLATEHYLGTGNALRAWQATRARDWDRWSRLY